MEQMYLREKVLYGGVIVPLFDPLIHRIVHKTTTLCGKVVVEGATGHNDVIFACGINQQDGIVIA